MVIRDRINMHIVLYIKQIAEGPTVWHRGTLLSILKHCYGEKV